MAFKLVKGFDQSQEMYCATSSTVAQGEIITFDRSAGKIIDATASLLAEDVAGVVVRTPGADDTTTMVIPAVPGQLWEWDCTSNTAANQLCKRHVLTDSLTVANTSTDQAVDEVVVVAIENVGAAADKKQRGYICGGPHMPGAVS